MEVIVTRKVKSLIYQSFNLNIYDSNETTPYRIAKKDEVACEKT